MLNKGMGGKIEEVIYEVNVRTGKKEELKILESRISTTLEILT